MQNGEDGRLDEVDRRILDVLAGDARIANNALAARVGVAPSTALSRMRSLHARGVVRGYYTDIDPAALGRPLQAMIAVRLAAGARDRLNGFVAEVSQLPEVRDVYFIGGADDFLVHVATADTEALQTFVVDHLSGDPAVASTVTNIVFSHHRGPG